LSWGAAKISLRHGWKGDSEALFAGGALVACLPLIPNESSLHTLAMNNRSVPVSTVLPHLVYRDIDEACAWLSRVFGFKEQFRYGQPVSGIQMFLGGAVIMLTGPRRGTQSPALLGSGTQTLTVMVADVDAHYARTKERGVMIWEELHETEYGERQYGVDDIDGHRWIFATHARDVSPEAWGATIVNPLP
jgi:uncharacterized glyoxalase superfamily protein PhnB